MDRPFLFRQALPYNDFLDRHANPAQRRRWDDSRRRVVLKPEQTALLASFQRAMPVLCLAGAWCGDCINQCPIFDAFAEASPAIDPRFLDRDAFPEQTGSLTVNGGNRVPIVLFLSEDFHEVFHYGERTLSIYRKLAEWLAEFERAQLILRLSPRLRELHGD